MTIETECPKCGKGYRVKDEMAGKRFRCKKCQSAISIPEPDVDEGEGSGDADSNEDWDQDFLGGLDSAVKSERTASAPAAEAPMAGRKKSKKAGSKSKSGKKKSSDGSGMASAVKLIGGLLGAGVGFVVAFVVVKALVSGGLGGSASWQEFSPPEGGYQLEMPATPKARTIPGANPAATTYVGETRNVACAVKEGPFPPGAENMTHQQMLKLIAKNVSLDQPGATVNDQTIMTFGDYDAIELNISVESQGRTLNNTSRVIIVGEKVYTIEYVDAGSETAADRDRFFNSFKLLDASGQPQPASWGTGDK